MVEKTLSDLLYDSDELGNYTLDEITNACISFDLADDPRQWTYVRAQTGDRGCMIKDTDMHVVLRTKTYKPLLDELQATVDNETNHYTLSECVDAMPRKMKRNSAVPSIRGEYLTIKKIRGFERDDGRIRVEKSSGFASTIPVEYVISPITYDEVVSELIDRNL